MKPSSFALLAAVLTVSLTGASCASSAHITVSDTADYRLAADFSPGSLLEKNIAHLMQHDTGQSIFNREELQRSLSEAGLSVSTVTLKGIMGLSVGCTLPQTHRLMNECIEYDRQGRRLKLILSPETIQLFLTMIPQESREFIDLLMAPLFTGDSIQPDEYEELIAAAYGKKVAAELRKSEFLLTLDVPYTIAKVAVYPIGTAVQTEPHSRRAVIRFPLIDLLCTVSTIEIRLEALIR
ncbi:MAG: hypothetical protein P1P65_02375 [Treponema sp.]